MITATPRHIIASIVLVLCVVLVALLAVHAIPTLGALEMVLLIGALAVAVLLP